MDAFTNIDKCNMSPDRGGGSLCGSQRGGLKDTTSNEVVCVLDLSGDLETGGHESGASESTTSKRKGGKSGTTEIQDAHTFIGCGVLKTSPFRTAKAASPSVWRHVAFVYIGKCVHPCW